MNGTSQVRRHGFRQFGVGIALYVAIVISFTFALALPFTQRRYA